MYKKSSENSRSTSSQCATLFASEMKSGVEEKVQKFGNTLVKYKYLKTVLKYST